MDIVLIGEILAVCLFFGMILVMLFGFPVAFSLGGISLIFAGIGMLFGAFETPLLGGAFSRTYDAIVNDVLIAIPLFVFMGAVLERSRIAEDLLITMGQAFGRLPGGLGFSVVVVGAMLAASTGIVGATVVAMGLISLPAMMQARYDQSLAAGIVTASGTLAQIIPPSTVLILIGTFMQAANVNVQAAKGNFAPDPVTVIEIFIGALLPGLILAGCYLAWVVWIACRYPKRTPPLDISEAERRQFLKKVLTVLVPPLALIVAVLGSILAGFATATESASVGAFGALLLAVLRGQISIAMLRHCCRATITMSSMIFLILIGAAVFSLVFRGLGGEKLIEEVFAALPGGVPAATVAVLLLMFVLGFFLDTFEIIFIVVPIFAPVLLNLGVDPLWLAVMMGVVLQTSYLTPPFGYAIFYLQGTARDFPVQAIYRGVVPFICIQILFAVMLWFLPGLATWLPKVVL